jgi:hypothetical protein
MWSLWLRSQATNSRPSQLVGIQNEYAAYCLDGAVTTFGRIVENALLERIEVGSGKTAKRVPRWTLKQILSDGFTFPREQADGGDGPAVDGEFYDEVR